MSKRVAVRFAHGFDLTAFEKRFRAELDREILKALKNPRDVARPRLIRSLFRQGIEFLEEEIKTLLVSYTTPGDRTIEGIVDADVRDRARAMQKWIGRAKAARQ